MARDADGPRDGGKGEARKRRLAGALRANLVRRRAQARARAAATDRVDTGNEAGDETGDEAGGARLAVPGALR